MIAIFVSSALMATIASVDAGTQVTVRTKAVRPIKNLRAKLEAQVLLGPSQGLTELSLTRVQLSPGAELPTHRHGGAELLFVLDGTLHTDGYQPRLSSGDALYVPSDTDHQFSASKRSGPVTFLMMHLPAGPEQFLETLDPWQMKMANQQLSARPSRSAEIFQGQKSAKVFPFPGGKGTVRIYFEPENTKGHACYLGVLQLDSGASAPTHVHANEVEVLYVLEGRGEMTVAGVPYPVEPQMALAVPKNTPHSFRVTSANGLRAVQLYSPAGPEQRFKAVATPSPRPP